MSKDPTITVLMPAFNASKYIKVSINSVLNQTYDDFELLIINDGSTDETLKIIEVFIDRRIRIINHKNNLGLIKSLNEGIKKSKGKYVARMDADDICHTDRLQKQLKYMEDNPRVGICGTWIKNFGDENYVWRTPVNSGVLKAGLFFESMMAHPSVMMNKELIMKNNLYYEQKYKYAEDYMLWIKASEKFDQSNLNEVLLDYRVHSHNVSRFYAKKQRKIKIQIEKYLLNKLDVKYNQQELSLQYKLSVWAIVTSEKELFRMRSWIKKLIEANSVSGIYNQHSFEDVLAERWAGIVYLAKPVGLKRYIICFSLKELLASIIKVVIKNRVIKFADMFRYKI